MKIFLALTLLSSIAFGAVVASYHADKIVHPVAKTCTCGPTCPTPTAKPWPIPASMERVR